MELLLDDIASEAREQRLGRALQPSRHDVPPPIAGFAGEAERRTAIAAAADRAAAMGTGRRGETGTYPIGVPRACMWAIAGAPEGRSLLSRRGAAVTVRVGEDFDERLRPAALAFVRALTLRTGGPVRQEDVARFEFEGQRIPLMDIQRGIRKPRMLDAALTFRTVFSATPERRPYADERGDDGYQRYKWRGTDPEHPENVALRRAMERRLPLIWFLGIEPGLYLPVSPVWLVGEEPRRHQFVVALDVEQLHAWGSGGEGVVVELRRAYADRVVRERLHQPVFRAQVLAAYENRCALCRLRHRELLDAAHIRSDTSGGEPVVTNGIAMCKIHHAAFDSLIMAVRPDYEIRVRRDVLAEEDGPTLRHALQGLHGLRIALPRRRAARPDPALLEERYERFLDAG